jgi:peptidoglycan/LPS O-acetylase OafA/YrhL
VFEPIPNPARPARATAAAYMPQLDSLRAIAVFGVLIHHFWPAIEARLGLTLGLLGVQLFFGLSGFLITGLLLQVRDAVRLGTESFRTAIGRFYARRFLRIGPLFYVTVAIAWIAGIAEVRDSLPWHLAYFSNFYFIRIDDWHGSISHFWSLAVEEQFYLVWPFVCVLAPRRLVLPLLIAVAVLAPTFRYVVIDMGLPWMVSFVTPLGNCDALAIGALLAYVANIERRRPAARSSYVRMAWWVGTPLVLAMWYMQWANVSTQGWGWLWATFENSAWALFFVAVIDRAARGAGGPFGAVLQARSLQYVGKISYGVYLLHGFMPHMMHWLLAFAGVPYPQTEAGGFLLLVTATIVAAAASWHYMERPIKELLSSRTYVSHARAIHVRISSPA